MHMYFLFTVFSDPSAWDMLEKFGSGNLNVSIVWDFTYIYILRNS